MMSDFSTYERWDSTSEAMPGKSAAAEAPWYALQVRPHFEKKTDVLLRRKGIATFLPLLREVHNWSDRRKKVEVPLFAGYDFVQLHLSPSTRKRVLETPGVIGFAGPQQLTPIPRAQVETLQQLLRAKVGCALRPFLRAGQRVRIRNGALAGLIGILVENAPKKLVVSIDCIERSVSIAIEGYDLELI